MADADPGLLGPESVTWQMHGDPMTWIAGVRALRLQALHPRAVRGGTQNPDARAPLWRRVAALAHRSLLPYAHELHGSPVAPVHTVDRRPRTAGTVRGRIPARRRRRLPTGHIPNAMARLGPGSRPTPYRLRGGAAILDGPGRAQQQTAGRTNGGDSRRWRTPG
ncbi:hypothetical protein ACGF8B_29775 [Streptomyces sp. NPDC047917]|uniref:hypothetical protein n=1 Tax=Streptomyces sp. NPDC047917 TaxID=3365491 RepID=UPI0037202BB6